VRNPYAPGAGTRPPVLAGRDQELAAFEVVLRRALQGRARKSAICVGLRGTGKTVLLAEFGRMASSLGFAVQQIELADGTHLRRNLAVVARSAALDLSATRRAGDRVRRVLGVVKGFTLPLPDGGSLSVDLDLDPVRGPADSGDLAHDVAGLLRELGEAAAEHGTGILLAFDELHVADRTDLAALITGMHRVHQLDLPIVLAGAGLPSLPGLLGEARTYAERMFTFPDIGPLDREEATEALVAPARAEGVSWTNPALTRVRSLAHGYPYFLQEFAKHAWDAAEHDVITKADVDRAEMAATAELDRSFFRVRMDRLDDDRRAYLRAMAALGPGTHHVADVAAALDATAADPTGARAALVRRGLVWMPREDEVAFTVPLFDDYVRRSSQHPDL
jgi:hypothetical protein